MSVTITDSPTVLSLQQTLGDYEVHVTGGSSNTLGDAAAINHVEFSSTPGNPPSWPQDHHRIPDYRPINRHLVPSERPNGSNGPERLFLTVMFTGVALNAGMAQLWGKTGGIVLTKLFRYAIGGEW